jgi:hypothetical protein
MTTETNPPKKSDAFIISDEMLSAGRKAVERKAKSSRMVAHKELEEAVFEANPQLQFTLMDGIEENQDLAHRAAKTVINRALDEKRKSRIRVTEKSGERSF